jgi:amino acid permease
MTVFGFIALVGWFGALLFLLLFVFHRSTRGSRLGDRRSRMFWLFIVADSVVMLMIYTTALLNIFLHEWPMKDAFRTVLGLSALFVIWWRVALFRILNMRKPKVDQQ